MVKCSLILSITAPAKRVSSRLNLSFQPEHPNNTFFFSAIKKSHTADRLGNEPVTTFDAPAFKAMCNTLVPLVVVNTNVFPLMKLAGYSAGELPYCKPGITLPSLSPAVIPFVCAPMEIHFSTVSTGIIREAPLYKAVAMVDVALKTSIITTMELSQSYNCNNLGDSTVCKTGLLMRW